MLKCIERQSFEMIGTLIFLLVALGYWVYFWPGIITFDAFMYVDHLNKMPSVGEWPVPESKFYSIIFFFSYFFTKGLLGYFLIQLSLSVLGVWTFLRVVAFVFENLLVRIALSLSLFTPLNFQIIFTSERDATFAWCFFIFQAISLQLYCFPEKGREMKASVILWAFIAMLAFLIRPEGLVLIFFPVFWYIKNIISYEQVSLYCRSFYLWYGVLFSLIFLVFPKEAGPRQIEGKYIQGSLIRFVLSLSKQENFKSSEEIEKDLKWLRAKIPIEVLKSASSSGLESVRIHFDLRTSIRVVNLFLSIVWSNFSLALTDRWSLLSHAFNSPTVGYYPLPEEVGDNYSHLIAISRDFGITKNGAYAWTQPNIGGALLRCESSQTVVSAFLAFIFAILFLFIDKNTFLLHAPIIISFMVVFFFQPIGKGRYFLFIIPAISIQAFLLAHQFLRKDGSWGLR